MIKPIFIFSLPRSGSTLLQRLLMSHKNISSAAEPWILLPLLHIIKNEGTATSYSHQTCRMAVEDMLSNMHGGKNRYNLLLREFVESIYDSLAAEGSVYFVDKTPRYYEIIPEIAEVFPDAKFVFLFRNPVHVYASIVSTWGKGNLNRLFHNKRDLIEGVKCLSEGYVLLKDKSIAISYENFVQHTEENLKALLQYLDLEYDDTMLANFSLQDTNGRMGDPTGVKQYAKITQAGMEKWMDVFNNRFRRRLVRNYILSLSEWVLGVQGYDKKNILEQIESLKIKWFTPPKDYFNYALSVAAIYLRLHMFFKKEMSWTRGKHID